MDNIKLYINASTEDVKLYLEKLIEYINKKNQKLSELYIKMTKGSQTNNYWSIILDKLNLFSNNEMNKKNENNIVYISTFIFLLFGIKNNTSYNKLNNSNINLELYEQSIYSNEIINFRNCVIIILIQNFMLNDNSDNNNKENKSDIINSIIRIIKCSYIKKSIHVIKSLLKKEIQNKTPIFITILFYFIYEKYKSLFSSFILSDNCDIKKEYKSIILQEYNNSFLYNEGSAMNINSIILEIKLSYSLLGKNPKEEKIVKYLGTIKDKKLKVDLLNVFEKYYYDNIIKKKNLENYDKNGKMRKVLDDIKILKKDVKDIKNNLEEMKNIHKNYIEDILKILNTINK